MVFFSLNWSEGTGTCWRETERKSEKAPSTGNGHTATSSAPFLPPFRILGKYTHEPGVFLEPLGPWLNLRSQPQAQLPQPPCHHGPRGFLRSIHNTELDAAYPPPLSSTLLSSTTCSHPIPLYSVSSEEHAIFHGSIPLAEVKQLECVKVEKGEEKGLPKPNTVSVQLNQTLGDDKATIRRL